ncbi:MAG: hypothetical protein WC735_01285 [Candidatus Paceibacterota bacterium]|jgi:hypothetical protein
MSKTIKTFLKYGFVAIVAIFIAFLSSVAFAIDEVNVNPASDSENGNENANPGSGSERGSEVNVNPGNGSENGNEGGNVDTIPGDVTPPDGGPTGDSSGSRSTGSSRTSTQNISDIKVTLVGSSVSITNLVRGGTYTISWDASVQNADTSISLVSSYGSNILIGTSKNANGANTLNWTVPTYLALGTYTLRFTDSSNRMTDASNVYRIVSRRSSNAGAEALGTGGGNLIDTDGESSTVSPDETEVLPSEDSQISDETSPVDQTAAVGNAFTDFLSNKYILWFFVLLLIIVGALFFQERKDSDKFPFNK